MPPTAPPAPSTLYAGLVRRIVPIALQCAACLGTERLLDFGPVPLPEATGIQTVHLNGVDIRNESFSSPPGRGKELAVSCFPLSLFSPEALSRHLDSIYGAAAVALFADFKVAERNIEIPASFFMGGLRRLLRDRGNAGNAFDALGGLEGLFYAEKARFRVLERHTLLGGALSCVLTERLDV